MRYFYYYLAVGVVVVLVISVSHQLTLKPWTELKDDLLDALYPEGNRFWHQFLANVLGPLMAAILMTVVWPILIYMKANEMFAEKSAEALDKDESEKEFAVKSKDILQQMTVAEIEKFEKVYDPMGAAPNVAFGHLNSAWVSFINELQPEDAIWSFTAIWTCSWGIKDLRTGYVIMRDGELGNYFMASRKIFEDE